MLQSPWSINTFLVNLNRLDIISKIIYLKKSILSDNILKYNLYYFLILLFLLDFLIEVGYEKIHKKKIINIP